MVKRPFWLHKIYPQGNNYVISPMITETFQKRMDDLVVEFISLQKLMDKPIL